MRPLHLLGLLGTALIFAVAFTARIDPPRDVYLIGGMGPLPPTCSFRTTTGLDCPGCGLTRSMISVAHGEILTALQFHPAGTALLVWGAVTFPYRGWLLTDRRGGQRLASLFRIDMLMLVGAAVLSIAWWFARLSAALH